MRSRFGNVANVRDVPLQDYSEPTGRYRAEGRELSAAVGARDLGYNLTILPPGARSSPFHFHRGEEEAFYVLEGHAVLRQGPADGEERIELGPGDVVAFPPGTGIAHQLLNEGGEPFAYLAISTMVASDVCEYPDSDKLLVRATRLVVRRTPGLEYFDGEV